MSDANDEGLKLTHLPDIVLDFIFLNLSYDEIAKNRVVCKKFDDVSKRLLNRGFNTVIEKFLLKSQKLINSKMPVKESDKKKHILASHNNIIAAIQTRKCMLSLTYSKYINLKFCCFIPGKILDEILQVLRHINHSINPVAPVDLELIENMRDLCSMAVTHFEEFIVPDFKLYLYNCIENDLFASQTFALLPHDSLKVIRPATSHMFSNCIDPTDNNLIMEPLKICSHDRSKRLAILVNLNSESLLEDTIKAANDKLGIQEKTTLKLESDGTDIDESFFIRHWKKELFMVLTESQSWCESRQAVVHSTSVTAPDELKNSSNDTCSEDKEENKVKKRKIVYEIDWEQIEMPWEAVSTETKNQLKIDIFNKLSVKQQKRAVTKVVHAAVDEIRSNDIHAPRSAFKEMAKKICAHEDYKDAFLDTKQDNAIQGPGYTSVLNKLLEHQKFLNRDQNTESVEKSVQFPFKDRKKIAPLKAGCSEWQPEFIGDYTQDKCEEIRLKFLNFAEFDYHDKRVCAQVMSDFKGSYTLQRLHINKDLPPVKNIVKLWPCLLDVFFLSLHFELLTDKNLNILSLYFERDLDRILTYGHQSGPKDICELKKWKALDIILRKFDEPMDSLFTFLEKGAEVTDTYSKKYPHILVFGPIPKDTDVSEEKENADENVENKEKENAEENKKKDESKAEYGVMLENFILPRTHSITEALKLLMASFFVFNFTYPAECPCTLEFLQRRFLTIFPMQSQRCRLKKYVDTVDRFIKRLKSINMGDIQK